MSKRKKDKCDKCENTDSSEYWDFDDGKVLCKVCHDQYLVLNQKIKSTKGELTTQYVSFYLGLFLMTIAPFLSYDKIGSFIVVEFFFGLILFIIAIVKVSTVRQRLAEFEADFSVFK